MSADLPQPINMQNTTPQPPTQATDTAEERLPAASCSASSITEEQIEILKHTSKNGRYCGGGKDMDALVAAGLMRYLGTPAWCPDPFYEITGAGKDAIRRQNTLLSDP